MMMIQLQIQSMIDEMKQIHMRMERAERKTQMLTDSFVVAGLWRTSSALNGWTEQHQQQQQQQVTSEKKEEDCHTYYYCDQDMLQFEMTTD